MATILIVDDRSQNREILRSAFSSTQHTVVEARDGEEGFAMAQLHTPELIVTDILMPKVDGFEFIQRLRANAQFQSTPIIVYSERHVEPAAHTLMDQCGVFKVVLKSAKAKELRDVAEQALQSNPSPSVAVGGESFDAMHRRLLTNKLADQVAQLEDEVRRRKITEDRLTAALNASSQRVVVWDLLKDEVSMVGADPNSEAPVFRISSYAEAVKVIHPEDLPDFESALERARSGRTEISIQYRLCPENQNESVIELRGRFQYDDSGTPRAMVGSLIDVTERVAAEKERNLLASIVEHSLDFIGSASPNGTVTFVNPAGRRIIGIDPTRNLNGESILNHIHPSSKQVVQEVALPRQMQTGEWRGELLFLNRETGDSIPCEAVAFTIRDHKGEVSNLAMVARDISERKSVERELRTRIAQLTALRRIDMAISGAIDVHLTLQLLMNEVSAVESVSGACIARYHPAYRELECVFERGLCGDPRVQALSESAVRERRPIRDSIQGAGIVEAMPLIAKGIVRGVLVVQYESSRAASSITTEFVEAISRQAAIALDNAVLFEDLQRSKNELLVAYDETIEGWSRALDLRGSESEGHSRRVMELTMKIAREMRVPADMLPHLRRGSLLHDIGKVGVPDRILRKKEPLDKDETASLERHPEYALQLLGPIAFLQRAIDIPYCHHERWDGAGYPRGLKQTQIPLQARMFAVAKEYLDLCSGSSGREGISPELALEEIRGAANRRFDPSVVAALGRVLNSE